MIEPLPDDLAHLFASERPLPPADGARQANVRARLWKTLGFGGGAPPSGGGGLAAGVTVLAIAVAAGTFIMARHDRAVRGTANPTPPDTATRPAAASSAPRAATSVAAQPEAVAPIATDWMGQLDVAPRAIDGVVTAGGRPLAGADVTLSSPSTGPGGAPLLHVVTGDDGRFHFDEQPAWVYTVVAEHAGLTAASARVDVRGRDGNVTLALTDCATRVRGSVRNGSGGAIAGVRVSALASPWHGPSTTTDANGDYALCVTSTKSRVRFAAEGFGTVDRVVDVAAAGAIADATLTRENLVVGSVVGPDDKPRGGVQVNLWHDAGNGNVADAHGVSDDEGHFEIGGVAAGRYAVTAWTRDAIAWTAHTIDVVDGLVEPVTLRLDATARIRGFVVRDGKRLAGADVVATRDGSPDLRSHHAISQDDGSFTLNGVPVGNVGIVVDGREVTALDVRLEGVTGLYVDAGAPPTGTP